MFASATLNPWLGEYLLRLGEYFLRLGECEILGSAKIFGSCLILDGYALLIEQTDEGKDRSPISCKGDLEFRVTVEADEVVALAMSYAYAVGDLSLIHI